MRVLPVTARAGAEHAERPEEGAKASSASGLRTISWAPYIYRLHDYVLRNSWRIGDSW